MGKYPYNTAFEVGTYPRHGALTVKSGEDEREKVICYSKIGVVIALHSLDIKPRMRIKLFYLVYGLNPFLLPNSSLSTLHWSTYQQPTISAR